MPLDTSFFEPFSFIVYRALIRSSPGGDELSEDALTILAFILEFDDARS